MGSVLSVDDVAGSARSSAITTSGSTAAATDARRGDAVPLLAQIMSIVDAFDAMATARPYIAARGRRRRDLVDMSLDQVARPGAA